MDSNNTQKQQLLIEYLISSPDTLALCTSIVRAEYFNPELKNTVAFIQKYFTTYNAVPTVDQIEAETGVHLKKHQNPSKDQIEYCATEIETFCTRQAVTKAVLSAVDLIPKGDYGTIIESLKEAITTSLQRDLGVNYFDNPLLRLTQHAQGDSIIPTRWTEFDELLLGGIRRKQMILFSANSGVGKSITMQNLAVNTLPDGINILYLSLELSEEVVAQRFDSMVTGIGQAEWSYRLSEIAHKIEATKPSVGRLYIKYLPVGTTSNAIRGFLKEFQLQHGIIPDMLVVDYIDLMGPNEYVSADNVFEKDKRTSEQLRSIGADYNMAIVTASQQNRSAVGETNLDHSHIAGGISKINTTDTYVSIIMTPAMKAAGQAAFQLLKTRGSAGVGKTIQLNWNGVTLRITNQKTGPTLKMKANQPNNETPKDTENETTSSLLDLIRV